MNRARGTRSKSGSADDYSGRHSGRPRFRRTRQEPVALRLRKASARQAKISELRADRFSLGQDRRPRHRNLFPLIDQVAAARKKRIPTPELNRWLKEDVDLQRGTTPKARPVKIYYMTQAKTSPPTFLIFTNQKDPLHFSYQRFLENQIREKWDFPGAPIRFLQRLAQTRTRHASGRANAESTRRIAREDTAANSQAARPADLMRERRNKRTRRFGMRITSAARPGTVDTRRKIWPRMKRFPALDHYRLIEIGVLRANRNWKSRAK